MHIQEKCHNLVTDMTSSAQNAFWTLLTWIFKMKIDHSLFEQVVLLKLYSNKGPIAHLNKSSDKICSTASNSSDEFEVENCKCESMREKDRIIRIKSTRFRSLTAN